MKHILLLPLLAVFGLSSSVVMAAGYRTQRVEAETAAHDYKTAGPVIVERCMNNGTMLITFDDGPHILTPSVLDVCKEKNVTCTFFINGNNYLNIAENTEAQNIVRRTLAEGHTVGSHTWSHKVLTSLRTTEIRREMKELSDTLMSTKILNKSPATMRPPQGEYNDQVIAVVTVELNYKIVNWSIDTNDWRHPNDTALGLQAYKDALEGIDPSTTPGFIALHHDTQTNGAELASLAIDYVRSKGWTFVSMDECLGTQSQ